jgi:2-phospho-L-lactate transferase/gluconeogenesis factor (CofD/UPF0052 family)
MKNVFFALAFMLIGTFAFANSSSEEDKVNPITTSIEKMTNNEIFPVITSSREIQIIDTTLDDEIVRCRVRTCYYQGGELINCTAWVNTYCDKDENGNLTEHFSQPEVTIGG